MKARDIMTRDVITVSPEAPIPEIARILHENRISGVPVVNEINELLGVVTEGDLIIKLARPETPPHIEILGGIFYLKSFHDMEEDLKKLTAVLARDIMTERVISIDEECALEDLASLMVNRKVNRLPVVKGKTLVGIVTRADLIETLMKEPPGEDEIHEST